MANRPRISRLLLILLAMTATAGSTGCLAVHDGHLSSRWAMNDLDYRTKYSRPHGPGDKYPRMLKQAVDARHVKDTSGMYVDWFRSPEPVDGGAVGVYNYTASWNEWRVGVGGMQGADTYEAFAFGLDGGVRVQSPTRVAPFVGVGGFAGWTASRSKHRPDDDDDDDPDDPFADDEDDDWFSLLASASISALYHFTEPSAGIYPEVGCHYWINDRHRITGFARYYLADSGKDFVLFGLEYGGATAKEPPPPSPIVLSNDNQHWLHGKPNEEPQVHHSDSKFVMQGAYGVNPNDLASDSAVDASPDTPLPELLRQSPFHPEPAPIEFTAATIHIPEHGEDAPRETLRGPANLAEFNGGFENENSFRTHPSLRTARQPFTDPPQFENPLSEPVFR